MIELLVFTPLPPKSINPVEFGENTRFSSGTINFIASIEFVERERRAKWAGRNSP
jgi:hypothetical protein